VVLVAATVEHRALDARGLGALGQQRAGLGACSVGLSPRSSASVQFTAAIVRPCSSSTSWAKIRGWSGTRTRAGAPPCHAPSRARGGGA